MEKWTYKVGELKTQELVVAFINNYSIQEVENDFVNHFKIGEIIAMCKDIATAFEAELRSDKKLRLLTLSRSTQYLTDVERLKLFKDLFNYVNSINSNSSSNMTTTIKSIIKSFIASFELLDELALIKHNYKRYVVDADEEVFDDFKAVNHLIAKTKKHLSSWEVQIVEYYFNNINKSNGVCKMLDNIFNFDEDHITIIGIHKGVDNE